MAIVGRRSGCCISQFVPLTKKSMLIKTCPSRQKAAQGFFLLTGMSELEAVSRIFSETHGESTLALIYEEVVELAFISSPSETVPWPSSHRAPNGRQ